MPFHFLTSKSKVEDVFKSFEGFSIGDRKDLELTKKSKSPDELKVEEIDVKEGLAKNLKHLALEAQILGQEKEIRKR